MMAAMAAFTINDTFMKLISGSLPFFETIFLRGVATSVFLGLLAWHMRALRLNPLRRDWQLILLRTVAEVAAAHLFLTALFNAPIADVTAILQALPLTVALAGVVFLGEPIGWRRLTAILVGFVGVMLIVQPGGSSFSVYSLYALGAVAAVTVRDLAARKLSRDVPSLTVAFIAGLAVTMYAGIGGVTEDWIVPDGRTVALLAGAVAFIAVAYSCSVMTMRVGDIGLVAPFRYTGLVWALVLGWVVFGDWPGNLMILGSAIVVATGIYTLLRERSLGKRPQTPALRTR